jgi:hypothetical protein
MTEGVTFTERLDSFRYLFEREPRYSTAADLLNWVTVHHAVIHEPLAIAAVDAVRDWLASDRVPYWNVVEYGNMFPLQQIDRLRDLFFAHGDTQSASEYLTWLILLRDDGLVYWASYSSGLEEIQRWLQKRAEGRDHPLLPLTRSRLPLKRAGGAPRGSGGVTS